MDPQIQAFIDAIHAKFPYSKEEYACWIGVGDDLRVWYGNRNPLNDHFGGSNPSYSHVRTITGPGEIEAGKTDVYDKGTIVEKFLEFVEEYKKRQVEASTASSSEEVK